MVLGNAIECVALGYLHVNCGHCYNTIVDVVVLVDLNLWLDVVVLMVEMIVSKLIVLVILIILMRFVISVVGNTKIWVRLC